MIEFIHSLSNMMENRRNRPLGVTIIAILIIISGILLLLSGAGLAVLGTLFSANPDTSTALSSSSLHSIAQFFGMISAAIGGILLAIGIGYIVMSYGLLKGKGWAWTISIILIIIGVMIQIASTSIGITVMSSSTNNANNFISEIVPSLISIAIDIVILYYLYRPHVKAYFGKAIRQRPAAKV